MERITNNKRTFCFVAGKSGGHIIPCLTLAQQIKEKENQANILFLATKHSLDRTLLSNAPDIDQCIYLPLGSRSYHNLFGIWHLPYDFIYSFISAYIMFRRHALAEFISTGGIVSTAPALAAWFLKIPITLYELNAIPGKAVGFLAPFATTINVCFKQTKRFFNAQKCHLAAYPLRFKVGFSIGFDANYQQKEIAFRAKKKKKLLIVGGSQGSQALNNLVVTWIKQSPTIGATIEIIHQTGARDAFDYGAFYAHHQIKATVFDYDNALEQWYKQADCAIARAGAGTLFELIFFNIPSIIIPLETHYTNHQKDNALAAAHDWPALITVVRQVDAQNNLDYFDQLVCKKMGLKKEGTGYDPIPSVYFSSEKY